MERNGTENSRASKGSASQVRKPSGVPRGGGMETGCALSCLSRWPRPLQYRCSVPAGPAVHALCAAAHRGFYIFHFLEVFFALISTGWGDDGAQGLRSCSHILNIVGIGTGSARSPGQWKKIDGGRNWALGSLPSTAYLPCGVCLDRGPWGADLAIVSFGCRVPIPARLALSS